MLLEVPQLIITPPSRESTTNAQPQLVITAADWERYPGITVMPPPLPPKSMYTSSPYSPSPYTSSTSFVPPPKYTKRLFSRPPSYRPPAPPVHPVELPTPTSEHAERWFISGRARLREGEEWERAEDEKCTSPIHDAADDAFMAYVGFQRHTDRKAREAGHAFASDQKKRGGGEGEKAREVGHMYPVVKRERELPKLPKPEKERLTKLPKRPQEEEEEPKRRNDANLHATAASKAREAGLALGSAQATEPALEAHNSYVAFTTAYAHVGEGYMDSWTTDRPLTSLNSRKRRSRLPRLPPPVMPLDLPGYYRWSPEDQASSIDDKEEERIEIREAARNKDAHRAQTEGMREREGARESAMEREREREREMEGKRAEERERERRRRSWWVLGRR